MLRNSYVFGFYMLVVVNCQPLHLALFVLASGRCYRNTGHSLKFLPGSYVDKSLGFLRPTEEDFI